MLSAQLLRSGRLLATPACSIRPSLRTKGTENHCLNGIRQVIVPTKRAISAQNDFIVARIDPAPPESTVSGSQQVALLLQRILEMVWRIGSMVPLRASKVIPACRGAILWVCTDQTFCNKSGVDNKGTAREVAHGPRLPRIHNAPRCVVGLDMIVLPVKVPAVFRKAESLRECNNKKPRLG